MVAALYMTPISLRSMSASRAFGFGAVRACILRFLPSLIIAFPFGSWSKSDKSVSQREEVQPAARPATLGDVLYRGRTVAGPAESDWIALVHAIAAGDQLALHALYERTNRLVFTLTIRITRNRETAEELTVDVFYEIWRRASSYEAANGTVLGWVMNLARSRAIDRLRFDSRKKRVDAGADGALAHVEPADLPDQLVTQEQAQAVVAALRLLTPGEQQAIEAAFLMELSHAEVAATLDQPLGTIKTRIRSGLHKLRQALLAAGMKR